MFIVPLLNYIFFSIFHQEALNTAKTEAQRWQSLYEELRLYSVQLKEKQHHSIDDLQHLHSQLEARVVGGGAEGLWGVSSKTFVRHIWCVCFAAVPGQRDGAAGGARVTKAAQPGATVQYMSAGGEQRCSEGGNTRSQRSETTKGCVSVSFQRIRA